MKVLITGASGFIGTNLIELLETKEYTLKNLDIEKPVKQGQAKYWENVNILDKADLLNSLQAFQPDIIIHLAAITDIYGKTMDHYKTNFLGTQNLIEASKCVKNLRRVIFTSTQYVCKLAYVPKHDEDYCPHTVYGESKVEMEKIIRCENNYSYDWIIIRPTSIWGPWFKYPYRKFFDLIQKGTYVDINKTSTKTFGFVKNAVFQIEKLMHAENVNRQTYYIGDLPAYNISEWAKEINGCLDKGKFITVPISAMKCLAFVGDTLKRVNIYFPMNSFRLKNMVTDNIMPVEKLIDVVGTPPYSRLEGSLETINWLKEEGKNYEM